jgi:FixJ family two-component response regulator
MSRWEPTSLEKATTVKMKMPKILVLDDDPVFRNIIVTLGAARNFDVEAYESLQEIDRFPNNLPYAGAILDYHFAETKLPDLLLGLDSFFKEIPTLLVSADEDAKLALRSNPSLRGFMSKSKGGLKILDALKGLMERAVDRSKRLKGGSAEPVADY